MTRRRFAALCLWHRVRSHSRRAGNEEPSTGRFHFIFRISDGYAKIRIPWVTVTRRRFATLCLWHRVRSHSRRAGNEEPSTGRFHLFFRISDGYAKIRIPWVTVTRRRFAALCLWHRVRSHSRRAGNEEPSTGRFHLFFRISYGRKKADTHLGICFFGDPPEIRTPDPLLKRQLLYRLS